MFKFSKMMLLSIVMFTMVACNSTPSNVSKDVYSTHIEFQKLIDDCFNDRICDGDKAIENVSEVMMIKSLDLNYDTDEEKNLTKIALLLREQMFLYKDAKSKDEQQNIQNEYQILHNEMSDMLNRKHKYN